METLTTTDGLRLHLRRWPARGPPRGTIQLVHGLGEHLGRYEALAAALTAAGWDVAGHDQRGHGRSEGARGGIAQPDSLLQDLARVSDHLRGAGRHLLLGHSMGGVVAARMVAEALRPEPARWGRHFDGLVLSSPAFDPGLGTLNKLLLATLAPLAPHLALGNGLRPDWISRDPEVVARYRSDALVHDRVTPRLVRFIVDEGALLCRLAGGWRLPTLLLWAGDDRCVAAAGSARFAAAAPQAAVTGQAFAGLYHEIFNEPEREQVLAVLTRWLAPL
jgi:alpha-beta hydrolase superfamily lysophospholipase